MQNKKKTYEWMCKYCGCKELRNETLGRPMPKNCPRRKGDQPHVWVKNRTI